MTVNPIEPPERSWALEIAGLNPSAIEFESVQLLRFGAEVLRCLSSGDRIGAVGCPPPFLKDGRSRSVDDAYAFEDWEHPENQRSLFDPEFPGIGDFVLNRVYFQPLADPPSRRALELRDRCSSNREFYAAMAFEKAIVVPHSRWIVIPLSPDAQYAMLLT
jgi:hypothetical protein